MSRILKAPDGKKYRIPDNATQEQIDEFIAKNAEGDSIRSSYEKRKLQLKTEGSTPLDRAMARQEANEAAGRVTIPTVNQNPTKGMSDAYLGVAGYGKAGSDLVQGAGQLLGLQTGADARETQRLDAPLMNTGAGQVGNFLGNAATAVPFGAAPFAVPKLAGAAGSIALGGAQGLLQPTTNDNVLAGKGANAAIGMGVSGMFAGLSKLANGGRDKFIETLRGAGVKTTPGQTIGGFAKTVEDKAMSIPITGDAIRYSRRKGIDEFNRAAYRYALDPIGENVDDIPVGRESIRVIGDKLGQAYDNILPLVKLKPDAQMAGDLSALAQQAKGLPIKEQGVYATAMREYILPKLRQGSIDGGTLKELDEYLRLESADYLTGDPYQRKLGQLLLDVKGAIHDGLIRSNPNLAERLSAIDEGWKAYSIIAEAGKGAKAAEGFTPMNLSQAVSQNARKYSKRAVSRGEAFMQDLSDAGINRLPSSYPDSGTPGRLAGMAAAGAALGYGGAAIDPVIPLAVGATTLPYLPGMRSASSLLASQVRPTLNIIGSGAKLAAPAGGFAIPSLTNLLKNAPESD